VAYKDPLSFQLPQRTTERNGNLEPLKTTGEEEVGGSLRFGDQRLYFQTLREMLESDHYQVALLPRRRRDLISGSQTGQFSPTASAVLIPFGWRELVGNVHECVREPATAPECNIARFGDVSVDFARMEMNRSPGKPMTMSLQELKTLKCFLSNPGRIFSRGELLKEAWGYENYPSTRTVDNYILRLRQKIERDPACPVHFLTVHRVGYKFVP